MSPASLRLGVALALVSLGGLIASAQSPRGPAAGPARVDFTQQIRPLLSDRCFRCHGPDARQAQGEAAARHPRRARSRRSSTGGSSSSRSIRAGARWSVASRPRDPDEMMPPPESQLSLSDDREGAARALGGRRCGLQAALVARSGRGRPAASRDGRCHVESDRCVRPRRARAAKAGAGAARVTRGAHSAARVQSHGPAADARRDRRLPGRSIARGLRARRRSLPRLAGVRRADGGGLARPGPLRRHLRLPGRRRARHVALPRLGDRAFNDNLPYDQFLTWQLAGDLLPDADARAADRHRVQPAPPPDQRGRQHRGGVPHRVRGRSRQHVRHRDARPDARVRPLPRSQVRSDHAARLLLAVRVLQQHRRIRPVLALHQCDADADAAACGRHGAERDHRPAPRRRSRATEAERRQLRRRAAPHFSALAAAGPRGAAGADRAPRVRRSRGRTRDSRLASGATQTRRAEQTVPPASHGAALQRRQCGRPSRRARTFGRTDRVLAVAAAAADRAQDRARGPAPVARLDRRRQPRLRADARPRPAVLRSDSLLAGQRHRDADAHSRCRSSAGRGSSSPTTDRAAPRACGSI